MEKRRSARQRGVSAPSIPAEQYKNKPQNRKEIDKQRVERNKFVVKAVKDMYMSEQNIPSVTYQPKSGTKRSVSLEEFGQRNGDGSFVFENSVKELRRYLRKELYEFIRRTGMPRGDIDRGTVMNAYLEQRLQVLFFINFPDEFKREATKQHNPVNYSEILDKRESKVRACNNASDEGTNEELSNFEWQYRQAAALNGNGHF